MNPPSGKKLGPWGLPEDWYDKATEAGLNQKREGSTKGPELAKPPVEPFNTEPKQPSGGPVSNLREKTREEIDASVERYKNVMKELDEHLARWASLLPDQLADDPDFQRLSREVHENEIEIIIPKPNANYNKETMEAKLIKNVGGTLGNVCEVIALGYKYRGSTRKRAKVGIISL